jgi:hypothetical protein
MTDQRSDDRAGGEELLLGLKGLRSFLAGLATLAAADVGPASSCGITLQMTQGWPVTVAASDALAAQLDEVQCGYDQGPCLTAARAGTVVHIKDLTEDLRWSDYRRRALERGIRSSLSLPLQAQGRSIGALNLYATAPNVFGEAETTRGGRFAAQATGALALATRSVGSARLATALAADVPSGRSLHWVMSLPREASSVQPPHWAIDAILATLEVPVRVRSAAAVATTLACGHVVTHGRARNFRIVLDVGENTVEITATDRGDTLVEGPPAAAETESMHAIAAEGLRSDLAQVAERVEIHRDPGAGVLVRVVLPLHQSAVPDRPSG